MRQRIATRQSVVVVLLLLMLLLLLFLLSDFGGADAAVMSLVGFRLGGC